jgi:hypothetical protein
MTYEFFFFLKLQSRFIEILLYLSDDVQCPVQ